MSVNKDILENNGVNTIESLASSTPAAILPVRNETEDENTEFKGVVVLTAIGGAGARVMKVALDNELVRTYVSLRVINTDKKDLDPFKNNPMVTCFEISDERLPSGAGGDPNRGETCMRKNADAIRSDLEYLKNGRSQVLFVTAGLGGGTGTGGLAPFLEIARSVKFNAVLALLTMPSSRLCGPRIVQQAYDQLLKIEKLCDGIMLISTGRVYIEAITSEDQGMEGDVGENEVFEQIYKSFVAVLASFVALMIEPSNEGIQTDLSDLTNPFDIFSSSEEEDSVDPVATSLVGEKERIAKLFFLSKGVGTGEGEERFKKAFDNALKLPYFVLAGNISGIKRIHWHPFVKGGDVGRKEINLFIDLITEATGNSDIDRTRGKSPNYNESVFKANGLQEGDLMLILMPADFECTPSEAFKKDWEWEDNFEKERRKKRKEAMEAEEAKAAMEAKTPAVKSNGVMRELPDNGGYVYSSIVDTEDKGGKKDAAWVRKNVEQESLPANTEGKDEEKESRSARRRTVVVQDESLKGGILPFLEELY